MGRWLVAGWLRAVNSLMMVLLLGSVGANAATMPLQQFFREQWTTRDGLPHNTINDIGQSGDGYLWLATWEGAARYDGRNFQIFGRKDIQGLPDNGMRTFWRDSDGSLLMAGSRGALARLNQGQWQLFPASGELINGVVRDDRGLLWLATEGGGVVRQLQDGSYQRFGVTEGLDSQVVYKVLQDSEGMLWFATPQGLYRTDPHAAQPMFQRVAAESGLPAEAAFVLALDPQHQLVVGTERGLFRREGSRFELLDPRLADLPVSAIYVQDNGDIWFGTVSQGLFRLSSYGLERLTVADGLPNNRVLAIFRDQEQSFWVGTNGGLFRLRETPFTNLNQADGLADNYVRTILQHSDGSVWVGSAGGLDRWHEGRISRVPLTAQSSILSLAQGLDGSIWVGTYADGLYQVQHDRVQQHFNRRNGLSSNEVRAIAPTPEGIWVGTSQGLNLIHQHEAQQATQVSSYGTAEGLPGIFVTALRYLPGIGQADRLLIGTGAGAAIMQHDQIKSLGIKQLDNAEYVFDFMTERSGDYIWLATDRGLARYRSRDGELKLLSQQQGLPVEKFFSILPETEQWLWFSSNRGVYRLAKADVMAVLDGTSSRLSSVELFGEQDGMASAQCNGGSMPAAAVLKDGSLWFATSQGVASVDPRQLARFSARTPPVVVQSLLADGQPTTLSRENKLSAGTRRVEVRYAGLSYIMPARIQYQTRLEGFDQDWVNRGNQHHVEYTNLTPGHYQLRVRAAYPDNEWSQSETSLTFRIAPLWWQRPLVQYTGLTLVLLMVALLVRWRLHRLSQSELKLRLQVAEKTAELLAQAQTLRQAVQDKTELAEQLKLQAQMFSRQAREDALTTLANRRAFDEQLSQQYQLARDSGRPLCLVLLDLDHFKDVNDRWSHQVGDLVLVQVAALLKQTVRDSDWLARWGGEEFAILLTDTTVAEAVEICQRLRLAIRALNFAPQAPDLTVTVSMGIALLSQSDSYDSLLRLADQQLYRAKNQGRDQVCYQT